MSHCASLRPPPPPPPPSSLPPSLPPTHSPFSLSFTLILFICLSPSPPTLSAPLSLSLSLSLSLFLSLSFFGVSLSISSEQCSVKQGPVCSQARLVLASSLFTCVPGSCRPALCNSSAPVCSPRLDPVYPGCGHPLRPVLYLPLVKQTHTHTGTHTHKHIKGRVHTSIKTAFTGCRILTVPM